MKASRMISFPSVVLASLFTLSLYTTGAAQTAPHGARAHEAADRRYAEHVNHFRGTAAKLGTTPEALAAAYERAQVANPRLTHGQFTAANMVARNLGGRHSNITTQAILAGLQGGKSIGQTLQALGLSASEAKKATKDADRSAKDANREAKRLARR